MTATNERHLAAVPDFDSARVVTLPLVFTTTSRLAPIAVCTDSLPSQCEVCNDFDASPEKRTPGVVEVWVPDSSLTKKRIGLRRGPCAHCVGWVPDPAA